MSGDPNYALEKLRDANYEMARGPGNVKDRLSEAFMKFHPVADGDFPDHLVGDYRWVMSQLTKFKCPQDSPGDVAYTLSRIRQTTGVKIAARLLYLESELAAYLDSGNFDNSP